MTWERFEALGSYLGRMKRSTSWWLGDLLNHGEKLFGEEVYQADEAIGLNGNTLRHYQYVCQQVPRSRRQRKLGFGHHVLVVNLGADEQAHWLREAARNTWRETDMREAMQEAGVLKPRPELVENTPLFPDDSTEIPQPLLTEVAEAILRDAVPHDDGRSYLVPSEDIARLRAVLGVEE